MPNRIKVEGTGRCKMPFKTRTEFSLAHGMD